MGIEYGVWSAGYGVGMRGGAGEWGSDVGGEGVVDGGLEAADVLHRQVVRVPRLQVLVEHRKDLVVENLELTDSVDHLLERLQRKRRVSRVTPRPSPKATDNSKPMVWLTDRHLCINSTATYSRTPYTLAKIGLWLRLDWLRSNSNKIRLWLRLDDGQDKTLPKIRLWLT